MHVTVIGFVLFFFSTTTFAVETTPPTEATYKIKQIVSSHNLVVIEQSPAAEVAAGKIFLVHFEDGKQCSLIVKEAKTNLIMLDSASCPRKEEISTKLSIEPSLTNNFTIANLETKAETKPMALSKNEDLQLDESDALRLSATIFYSAADEMKFNDSYVSSSSGSAFMSSNFKTTGAVGAGVSIAFMPSHDWGASLSANYEDNRELSSVTFSASGATFSGVFTGLRPKVSIFYAETQLIYRWNKVYLPFGINFSAPFLKDVGNSSFVEVRGTVGAVVGVGIFISPKLSAELFLRSLQLTMDETAGTTNVDYGRGTLTGASFGFKFFF